MKRRFLCLGAVSFLLAGCAPPGTYRKVRESIRAVAVEELGPADRYDVSTSRDDLLKLARGRISRIDVHGINVRPAPGYVLDEILLTARNVRINRNTRSVESADETVAKAYVSESSLATILEAEGTVRDCTVQIEPNHIHLSGQHAVFGALPVSIVAVGNLRIEGRAGLRFVSESVSAHGVPLPVTVTEALDFAAIYPALLFTDVSLENGRVVISGTLDWSKLHHG
jgi:hypothetical protein